MDPKRLKQLLQQVANGKLNTTDAMEQLSRLPYEATEHATVDHHRLLRTGVPEVVYGEGKSAEQIIDISNNILKREMPLLVTRVDAEKGQAVAQAVAGSTHDPLSRTVYKFARKRSGRGRGLVAVVTAGTSDLPVAEEAAITLEMMGERVERVYDVGVAGVHRLFDKLTLLRDARAIVVAAGMEGALASIIGGVVACPVVAVPTSIGYGASFGGLAALLGMLTSCAPGVTVVNIDNGFGAAVAAGLINRRGAR